MLFRACFCSFFKIDVFAAFLSTPFLYFINVNHVASETARVEIGLRRIPFLTGLDFELFNRILSEIPKICKFREQITNKLGGQKKNKIFF